MMTPEAVTATGMAWILAAGTLLGGLVTMAASVYAVYTAKFAKNQADLNSLRLNGHSSDIKQIMLSTPPPGGQINVNNAAPAEAKETV